jgi:hypothetical protein
MNKRLFLKKLFFERLPSKKLFLRLFLPRILPPRNPYCRLLPYPQRRRRPHHCPPRRCSPT